MRKALPPAPRKFRERLAGWPDSQELPDLRPLSPLPRERDYFEQPSKQRGPLMLPSNELPSLEVPTPPRKEREGFTLPQIPLPVQPKARAIVPPPSKGQKGPPLFIKIDKYREVVNNLSKLKTYSLSLRDSLDALSEIEKELQRGLSLSNRALDNFNTIIASLDSKISRLPPSDVDEGVMDETSEYVKSLHDQVERIRSDLKGINL